MSTQTEKIKNLARELDARDRAEMSRESEPSPVDGFPASSRALVRSAGVSPHEADFIEPPFRPGINLDNLPADIADGIRAAHAFFNLFEKPCPGEFRDFAFAAVALSELKGTDFEPIEDSRFARMMNLSRETVRVKREGFFDWQDKSDLGLIDFKSQERDAATRKYHSNLYRVRLGGIVASFVRVAREGLPGGNPKFLIENSVETGLKELHEQVCSSIPNAEIVKRAKKRRAEENAKPTKTATAKTEEDKLVERFDKWCGRHSEDLHAALEILYARFNSVIGKYYPVEE